MGKNILKDFFISVLFAIILSIITIFILLIAGKLTFINYLNTLFFEGSALIVLSGIFSLVLKNVYLSELTTLLKIGKKNCDGLFLFWSLFIAGITLYLLTIFIHLIFKPLQ